MVKAIPFEAAQTSTSTRTAKLFLGIVFDLIGMFPSIFPPLAFIWAPLSALLLTRMYKGKIGKIAGIFDFIEEMVPVVDFIPTFTITWFYVYVIKSGK
ncbi:hypothetical protein [Flavobacterium sp.]|uniref:hypothetical protein n=1 Tax=Flavobacterium sp. TaxID=239 RepID=UPI00248742EC|nr:hypothetical protein [Flavobacterium sp.]MDI1317518.1 hypothetical protein [Flavobacterium sp.]